VAHTNRESLAFVALVVAMVALAMVVTG